MLSEDYKDYYLGTGLRLLARSSEAPWNGAPPMPGDPLCRPLPRAARPVGSDHPVAALYDRLLRARFRRLVAATDWSAISVLRLGFCDGEDDFPVVVLVVLNAGAGVDELWARSLAVRGKELLEAAATGPDLFELRSAGVPDVEVEIAEAAPASDWGPETDTVGPLEPCVWASLRVSAPDRQNRTVESDVSKGIFVDLKAPFERGGHCAVTCHPIRQGDIPYVYMPGVSQKRPVECPSPDDYARTMAILEVRERELLRQEAIPHSYRQDITTAHVAAQRTMILTSVRRIPDFGYVLRSSGPTIDAQTGCLLKWTLVEVDPCMGSRAKSSFPWAPALDELFGTANLHRMTEGAVRTANLQHPNNPDALSAFVFKLGRETGLRCGLLNNVRSDIRSLHPADDDSGGLVELITAETVVLDAPMPRPGQGFRWKISPFSRSGDSGATVIDFAGAVVGMLVTPDAPGQWGPVSVVTPVDRLLESIWTTLDEDDPPPKWLAPPRPYALREVQEPLRSRSPGVKYYNSNKNK
ncbi:hypothetical protein DL766_004681 [Monosporascus sp. MC13-8B]|uniref:Uncharacterized protein n=1 Tax=Monosporascus cannonballus TaxID=155416 RepID=A0ABY0HCJ0_9PEZI|nr:hypothetical protein DL762_004331 [Monosporascus cannonballus]RYO99276.1 hypothetical protein DL763_001640 [Monosporascus cannonballus]RYP30854.1 hypothetical protein DL766_004681 [Monosporascus sp. MC13-8B]